MQLRVFDIATESAAAPAIAAWGGLLPRLAQAECSVGERTIPSQIKVHRVPMHLFFCPAFASFPSIV